MWRPWSCENESVDIDTVEEIDIMNIDNEDEEFINTPSENGNKLSLFFRIFDFVTKYIF